MFGGAVLVLDVALIIMLHFVVHEALCSVNLVLQMCSRCSSCESRSGASGCEGRVDAQ